MNTLTRRQARICKSNKRGSGFTLVEVMVVLTILGVLAALATPTFKSIVEKWRVQQAVESMKSTLYYARSEAIKRGGRITVLRNALTTECPQASTTQEWSCGWMVFVDTNDNGTRQATEVILQTFFTPTGVNVMNSAASAQTRFKVDRWGQINGLGAQGFIFSPTSSGVASPYATKLCVSSGGRIQANPNHVICK